MPEGFEQNHHPTHPKQNHPTNPHPVHALGTVNISADAWTSRAGTLYVAAVHRLEEQNPMPIASSTVTVDNASDRTLLQIPTRWMSGMRCLAHLLNLQAGAQDHQLREQENSPTEDHP
ncbi:hypothetical protein B0H11DRAFT_1934688 [Mycena galericulata]|nr:hypothetical protein B0H11DRAFT_1934688 [Mycena galericulata]